MQHLCADLTRCSTQRYFAVHSGCTEGNARKLESEGGRLLIERKKTLPEKPAYDLVVDIVRQKRTEAAVAGAAA